MWDPDMYAQAAIYNAAKDDTVRATMYSSLTLAAAIERLAKAIETSQR